jgi:sialate O-acetylesterase
VVEIADQKKETRADDAGRWKVVLGAMQAGDVPVTMTVSSSGGRKVIRDILIGEVWLGSGQSNMAMTVSRAMNFEKEKAAAHLPSIRCFTTVMQNAATPQETCEGQWKVCSVETVGAFSATGYFFAREVHQRLQTPVGLVISAVGGTPIDAWVDGAKQRARPELKPLFSPGADFDVAKAKAEYEAAKETWKIEVKKARAEGKAPPRPPRDPVATRERKANVGGLFNGMINPLVPMALRGVLWYQGEANTVPEKARLYQHQLPLLVTDWRERWGCELPVAWVQLPNFSGNGRDLPSVREAMAKTLRLPRTGMAVTIDIGETKDIHPKNKQEVGRRLSLWALHEVYGKTEVAFLAACRALPRLEVDAKSSAWPPAL